MTDERFEEIQKLFARRDELQHIVRNQMNILDRAEDQYGIDIIVRIGDKGCDNYVIYRVDDKAILDALRNHAQALQSELTDIENKINEL